ncbi:MAG: hypothetical protein PHV37_04220 [Candidatus Gastranaerophilales bacterium]|nr:hypothetical protein [Candidatus Gastranaerophilales bacterium]
MSDLKYTNYMLVSALILILVTSICVINFNLGCNVELDTQIIAAFNA